MKKVAINTCYGGFSISNKAIARIAELQGKTAYFFYYNHITKKYTQTDYTSNYFCIFAFDSPIPENTNEWYKEHNLDKRYDDRSDPYLIQVIEELGEEANGEYAKIEIVEIPDDVDYVIEEYDGKEWIAESHRTWG